MIESLGYLVAFTTVFLLIEPCLRSDNVSPYASAEQIIKRRRLPVDRNDPTSSHQDLSDDTRIDLEHLEDNQSISLTGADSAAGGAVAANDSKSQIPQSKSYNMFYYVVYFLAIGACLATGLGLFAAKTAEWGFGLGIATTVFLLFFLAHMYDLFGATKTTKKVLGISMATVGVLGPSITLAATGNEALGITWGWAPMGYLFSVAVTVILLVVIWYKYKKDNKSAELSPNVASSVFGTIILVTSGVGAISFTNAASGLDGWAVCFITIGVLSSVLTIWISSIVINQSEMSKCAKAGHYTLATVTAVGVGGALASGLLKVNGNLTEHELFNADSCPVLEVVFPVFAAMGGCFAIVWVLFALRKHMACGKCKKLTKDNEPGT